MEPMFQNRRDAGRALASKLLRFAGRSDVMVLALPRGGVPVAYEVARALGAPLDVFLVRKLGVPGHEELAMGAIASGGVRVLNQSVISHLQIPEQAIERVAVQEGIELARREKEYRQGRGKPDVAGRTVILVDDGLATGSTMRAAAAAVRQLGPERVVVAVPTASPETCLEFSREPAVDEIVCAVTPEEFKAVGMSYKDFTQTTDEQVHELLGQPAPGQRREQPHNHRPGESHLGRGG